MVFFNENEKSVNIECLHIFIIQTGILIVFGAIRDISKNQFKPKANQHTNVRSNNSLILYTDTQFLDNLTKSEPIL